MKRLILSLFLITLFLLTACANSAPADLSVDVLKIGQADAIILRTAAETVLIDTGEEDDGTEICNALSDMGIDTLDYLIITHYDKDHIGSAAKVLANLNVKELIEPGYEKEGDLYSVYRRAADTVPCSVPTEQLMLSLKGIQLTIYPPTKAYAEENNASLVTMVTCNGTSLLFTGDIMQERIDDLLSAGVPLDADFLKIPHHGKFNDSSAKLIEAVSPVGAVITSSDKNPAEPELLALLDQINCSTLETRDGNIHIELRDGKLSAEQTN